MPSAYPDLAVATTNDRTGYRADIDGLRAVAIGLVVAFHFGIPGLNGGYLGVDVFFVISGYLIASIFEGRQALSWRDLPPFYARRIKRLMPAFLFVAVATIAVATVLLLPEDYNNLLRSIRDSLLFRANVYFDRVTTDYFAANAGQLPWLHTWSLSVEWQFYFAFPVLFLALGRMRSARTRIGVSLALVLVGIAVSVVMTRTEASHAYFSTPARFFEFLLGALAAAMPRAATSAALSGRVAWLGVGALVAMAATFDAGTPFPGLYGLAVCFVAFLLIVTGGAGSWLAHPVFAWLGRRSYSIYLWHWPIVALSDYVQRRWTLLETIAWIAVIVLLSDATYRLVERPFIAAKWGALRAGLVCYVVPFACVIAFSAYVRHYDGFPARLGPEAAHAHADIARFESHREDHCHDDRDGDLATCAFGDPGSSVEALMIGDSHARHFRPFFDVLARDAHVKAFAFTNSECPTLETGAEQAVQKFRRDCVAATERDFALIRSRRFRYVVFAERWIGYPPAALAGLDHSVAVAIEAGAVPVLFAPIAEDGTETRDCFYHHIKVRQPFVDDCAIRRDNPFARDRKHEVAALLGDLKRKYPTLILIDPQSVQCHDETCDSVIDGTPIYVDTHHLSQFGSTMLGRAYLARLGNPLLPHASPP